MDYSQMTSFPYMTPLGTFVVLVLVAAAWFCVGLALGYRWWGE